MKQLLTILLLLLCTMALAACGAGQKTGDSPSNGTSAASIESTPAPENTSSQAPQGPGENGNVPDRSLADYAGIVIRIEEGTVFIQPIMQDSIDGFAVGALGLEAPEESVLVDAATRVYIEDYNKTTQQVQHLESNLQSIPTGAEIYIFGTAADDGWQAECIIALRVSE